MPLRSKYTIEDMQALAEERGGKCLSENYVNPHTKLEWKCEKGHVWFATPNNVKRGSWCPECGKLKMGEARKLSIEEMREIAKKQGGECLSKKYIDSHTKLKWKCGKNHTWFAVPNSIKNGTWCPECARKKVAESQKLSIEEMQKIANKRGGKCLSKKYLNASSKLKWQCQKKHIWYATPNHIKNGQWCPYCYGKNQNIDDMRKIAKKHAGFCLSEVYVNSTTKLVWQCKLGHIWNATPSSIKSGHWCPECGLKKKSESRKFTIEKMQEIAQERGGKCLSKKYINIDTKLKWQCSEGHIWKAIPYTIKKGNWCPVCSEGLGERICRTYFEQLFKRKFPKRHPKWLLNKENNQLELDGYCKSLGLAFEHQGMQHFKRLKYFHQTIQDFKKLKRDDKEKIDLCNKNSITLIQVPEIPQLLVINEVKDFIINKCKEAGFHNIPKDVKNTKISLKNVYTPNSTHSFETVKNIAQKKGGKCLSQNYSGVHTKLKWECGEKHQWEATPGSIKRGTWCPECANVIRGMSKRSTIEEMQEIAKERGGKCLSKKYINNHTKLKWKCNEGHIWETPPNYIKSGTWCPICGNKKAGESRKLTIEKMYKIAIERGGKCLSRHYIDANTKLKWQCKNGHIWEATPHHIKNGTWCPECAGRKKGTIEEMRLIAKQRNGKCISEKYINARTKLQWQCSKGHIWEAVPDSIKRGSWCPQCVGNVKLSIKEMQKLAKERGGKCLSEKYINARTKLKWQCSEGHIWEAVPDSIRRGSWCPECAKNNKGKNSLN